MMKPTMAMQFPFSQNISIYFKLKLKLKIKILTIYEQVVLQKPQRLAQMHFIQFFF
jgi:hypothetical protein